MNFSWVVGVDNNMEDLLPWWYENIKEVGTRTRHNHCDFGMSSAARTVAKKYADTFLEI